MTLVWVRFVDCKSVGVVGGVRTLAAATEPTTTNARTRASAAPVTRRTTAFLSVMCFPPLEGARWGGRRVHLSIGAGRADGLDGFRGLVCRYPFRSRRARRGHDG